MVIRGNSLDNLEVEFRSQFKEPNTKYKYFLQIKTKKAFEYIKNKFMNDTYSYTKFLNTFKNPNKMMLYSLYMALKGGKK